MTDPIYAVMEASKVLWVIQENRLGWSGTHDNHMLESFLEAQGTPYIETTIIPFDDGPLPTPHWTESKTDWDGPVIFYGSTKLVERASREKRWKPGVWYDENRFSMEMVYGRYDRLMLNDDSGYMMYLKDLLEEKRDPEEDLFIRPVHDLKEFVGAVRKFKELPELLRQSNSSSATEKTEVLIAKPKNIHREWRCFMVDGKCIAHSEYKRDGELVKRDDPHLYTPADVTLLAEKAAKLYSPAAVFVIDIAELPNGDLKIVETNCFNCAGVYHANLRDIAREVTAYTARTYAAVAAARTMLTEETH